MKYTDSFQKKSRKNQNIILNNTCQKRIDIIYYMSVFGEWYALLKDTTIRSNVEISIDLTFKRDAMMREVTELSDNSCGELSAHRSGRRDKKLFFMV